MIQSPAIARIRSYLDQLENPKTSAEHRLAHWKLIISAAYDAHELEVQQLDVANRPTLESATAGGA